MQIKVTQCGDREQATVEVINPASGDTLSCTELSNGQSVTLTSVNAHDGSDIQVGEVDGPVSEESEQETAAETGEPGDGGTDGTSVADGAEPDPA